MAVAVSIDSLRKAAILLLAVGEQASAEVIKQLSDEEVQRVTHEIARVSSVTAEQTDAVLNEYQQITKVHEYVLQGGVESAKRILVGAYGPEVAQTLIDRLVMRLSQGAASFDALHRADPQQLAKFIHSEHPQTVALILSHLNPSQAAALLTSLPANMRSDVALRMANLDQISPDVMDKIAAVIGQKLQAQGEISRESYGGVHAVAEMLNRLDSGSSKEMLDGIEPQNVNLVEHIRHLMFMFEDLVSVDANGMKAVIEKVDRKILTIALKGTSDQLRNHFTQGMSQRSAEMLREEMETLGPVKIRDVEAAQQQVMTAVRQLESEGAISLKSTAGEQYIV